MNRLSIAFVAAALVLSGCRNGTTSATQTDAGARPPAQTSTAPAVVNIPSDLHFSPSDVAYLQSVDASTRDAAIRRRREDMEAIHQAVRLTRGYTDSLQHWSISTRNSPAPAAKQ